MDGSGSKKPYHVIAAGLFVGSRNSFGFAIVVSEEVRRAPDVASGEDLFFLNHDGADFVFAGVILPDARHDVVRPSRRCCDLHRC